MFIFYITLFVISVSAADADDDHHIISIREESPSNISFSSLLSNHRLQWLPSSYAFQSYFHLSSNQSLSTTNRMIDREEFCEKKLCNCSQCWIYLNFLQTLPRNNISIRTIAVLIEDINDHSPTFKQSLIQLSIAENVPIGYEIPLESAIDEDDGVFSIQTYELYPQSNNPFRLIKASKPILKLNQPLDREMKSNYVFKLIAYDGGQPILSGEQTIEITITDVNDNPPIFDQIMARKSLPENQQINSIIYQVQAHDLDEGENARISYSIDEPSSTFSINQQTGDIYLNKSLDFETIRSYSITIKANDHGLSQLNNYATLIIDITDVNDHTPKILLTDVNSTRLTDNQITLLECTSKDTPLLYIYITDEDSGTNARVNCVLNDTRLHLISLTNNAYALQSRSSNVFDYEIEQIVPVQLQCFDFGQPSLSSSISVDFHIENCNDNPPEILFPLPFNQPMVIPYETSELPFFITQFVIEDRDDRFQSSTYSYSFLTSPSLAVSLNENGTLILHSMPAIIGLFTINVTVYDITNLTADISLPINIQSINETTRLNDVHIENTNLILVLTFLIIVFLAAVVISICFLVAFLCRTKQCHSPTSSPRTSSCESITSSNERTNSSQKTTIEVLDELQRHGKKVNSRRFDLHECTDREQRDFNYSEKVEKYLIHLNNGNIYDLSQGHSHQHSPPFYSLVGFAKRDTSVFSSDSLYV